MSKVKYVLRCKRSPPRPYNSYRFHPRTTERSVSSYRPDSSSTRREKMRYAKETGCSYYYEGGLGETSEDIFEQISIINADYKK